MSNILEYKGYYTKIKYNSEEYKTHFCSNVFKYQLKFQHDISHREF